MASEIGSLDKEQTRHRENKEERAGDHAAQVPREGLAGCTVGLGGWEARVPARQGELWASGHWLRCLDSGSDSLGPVAAPGHSFCFS